MFSVDLSTDFLYESKTVCTQVKHREVGVVKGFSGLFTNMNVIFILLTSRKLQVYSLVEISISTI